MQDQTVFVLPSWANRTTIIDLTQPTLQTVRPTVQPEPHQRAWAPIIYLSLMFWADLWRETVSLSKTSLTWLVKRRVSRLNRASPLPSVLVGYQ